MSMAHLVPASDSRLRFSVCLLSPSLEEAWRRWKISEHSLRVCHDSFMFELVFVWELHVGREREFVFIFQGFLCFLSEYMHFKNIAINSSLWVLVFVSSLMPTWCQKILDGDVREWLPRLYESSMMRFAEAITAILQRHVTFIWKLM